MKTILNKTISFAVIAILALSFGAQNAFAAVQLNDHPNDCRTVGVGNVDTGEGIHNDCWDGSTHASSGDDINVIIYFHNSGSTPATDVRLKLDKPNGPVNSFTFSGSVSGSGDYEPGTATVYFDSSVELVFDKATIETQSTSRTTLSNGSALFSSNGLNIGTVNPGWSNQGVVKAVFRVEGDNNSDLDIKTINVQNVYSDSAKLIGHFEGENVTTWFEYDTDLYDLEHRLGQSTSHDYHGTGNGSFNDTINNLQSGTKYFFMACGSDSYGNEECDPYAELITQGNAPEPEPEEEELDVTTNSASDIDQDHAQLNGEYDNADDGDVFFVWSDDESDIDDATHENDSDDISNNVQVNFVEFSAYGDDHSVDLDIYNLDEDTEYFFALCVEQDNDIECGSVKSFTTDDYYYSDNDDLDVTTENATNIDDDRARLNGEYDDADDADIFFVWGEDKSDIEDVEDEDEIDDIEDKNKYRDVEIKVVETGAYGDDHNVSRTVTGLDDDTRYYFRLCAEEDNELTCGSVRSFTTDDTYKKVIQDDLPNVTSCAAIGVGITNATFTTYQTDADRVYFQYGTTTSLGKNTLNQYPGYDVARVSQLVYGLLPNTTYYCQAIAENSEGTTRGDIGSFRTGSLPVIIPGNPNPPVIVTSGGTGDGSLVFLEIDDNQETATRGEILQYEVEWKNTSGKILDEVALYIQLPKATRFISSTDGNYNLRDHAIYVPLGQLDPKDEDDMTITVRVTGARQGEPIVAEAILAFENPEKGGSALLNAVELDADTYVTGGVGLGAGLFGLGLPTTLLGWLLLLLVLIVLVLMARYFYYREKERHMYYRNVRDVPPPPPFNGNI